MNNYEKLEKMLIAITVITMTWGLGVMGVILLNNKLSSVTQLALAAPILIGHIVLAGISVKLNLERNKKR